MSESSKIQIVGLSWLQPTAHLGINAYTATARAVSVPPAVLLTASVVQHHYDSMKVLVNAPVFARQVAFVLTALLAQTPQLWLRGFLLMT